MQSVKSELRKSAIKKRRALDCSVVAAASDAIAKRVCERDFFKNSEAVLLYSAISNEVSCARLFEASIKGGKKTYFPRVLYDGSIDFLSVRDLSEMTRGTYGILEPYGGEPYRGGKNSICIVPGLMFDCDGYRLGYGKGCYDRFLSGFDGIAAGVLMDMFLTDRLARFDTDVSVDYIITESKILVLKDGEANG